MAANLSNVSFSDMMSNDTTDATADANLALFNYIVNVYVDGILCALGAFGNIMIIVVLRRKKTNNNKRKMTLKGKAKASVKTSPNPPQQSSNAILLQGLAAYDLCFLSYVLLYVVLRSIHTYSPQRLQWIDAADPYIVAFVLPFGWTSQTATIWMMMMVTVDRFWIVSRPLTGALTCNPAAAKRMTVAVAVAAVLFNAVRWPRYYFVAFHYGSNTTFVSHVDASIRGWDDDLYLKIYHISLTFFFLFIVPLGVIIVLNAKLVVYLRNAGKQHEKLVHRPSPNNPNPNPNAAVSKQQTAVSTNKNAANATSMNLTRMIVIMITIFIICELPDFIAGIIGAGKFQINQQVYRYYAPIKEAMLVFNSALNFYLYLLLYRNFRKSFLEMFGRREKAQQGDGKLSTSSSLASSVNSIAKTVSFSDGEYVNEQGFNTRL